LDAKRLVLGSSDGFSGSWYAIGLWVLSVKLVAMLVESSIFQRACEMIVVTPGAIKGFALQDVLLN